MQNDECRMMSGPQALVRLGAAGVAAPAAGYHCELRHRPMDDRPWYHKGLRFHCTGCGGCCVGEPGYVWVNKAEIEAMAAALKLDVARFEEKYVRLVGIRKSLIELPNGDCIFFDSRGRSCQIYELRPRQCRTWPFWASNLRTPQTWQETCLDCPGANHGPRISLSEIHSRLRVVRV